MDTTFVSKHELAVSVFRRFSTRYLNIILPIFLRYGIAVLGTPNVPLLNNWFDNSCSSINDDCACWYFYESLSLKFPTFRLTFLLDISLTLVG